MNKQLKKQVHAALKEAKKYLYKGGDEFSICGTDYICIALAMVADDNLDHCVGVKKARNIISKRLDGFYTIDAWLRLKDIPRKELSNHKKMQTYRHAWLDMLIEEFSE